MKSLLALLRRKFFRNFFLSLLLVFVLPTLALTGALTSTLHGAEQEMRTQRRLLLEQIKGGMDAQLISLMRMGEKLVADDKVLYFATRADPLAHLSSPTTFETLRQLMAELSSISMSNSAIARCYLYFQKSDKVLSAGSMFDSQDFYTFTLRGDQPGYAAWLAFLRRENNGFMRADTGADEGALSYVRTISWGQDAAMTIVLSLSDASLDAMQRMLAEHGGAQAALYNAQGQPLYAAAQDLAALAVPVSPDLPYAVTAAAEPGAQIAFLHSADTGCAYALRMPDSLFGEKVAALRWQIGTVTALMLLCGVLVSLLLARRNYRPIRSLMAFVSGQGGESAPPQGDDFSYLQQMLASMEDQRLSIAQRLRYQSHTMRGYLLDRLLTGNYPSARRMEEELLKQDFVFVSDAFIVVAARLDGFEPTGAAAGDAEQSPDTQLLRFAASNVLEELLSACVQAHLDTVDGRLIVLVNLPEDTPQAVASLQAPLTSAQQLLLEHFDLQLSIAASTVHIGLPGIPEAYQQALGALLGDPSPAALHLLWQRTPPPHADTEHQALHAGEWQPKLAHLLLSDADAAVGMVSALVAQVATLPPWRAHLALGDVLSVYYRAMLVAQPSAQTKLRWETTLAHLQAARPGESPLPALTEMARELCACAAARTESGKGTNLAERVHAYIAQHYQQDSLNVTQIADALGMHPSYASSLYRRQTGESLLDAINRVRLAQAKRLLLGTRRSVVDISTAVGYYDSAALIRALKRYEGVTPGQYRALHSPAQDGQ